MHWSLSATLSTAASPSATSSTRTTRPSSPTRASRPTPTAATSTPAPISSRSPRYHFFISSLPFLTSAKKKNPGCPNRLLRLPRRARHRQRAGHVPPRVHKRQGEQELPRVAQEHPNLCQRQLKTRKRHRLEKEKKKHQRPLLIKFVCFWSFANIFDTGPAPRKWLRHQVRTSTPRAKTLC